MSAAVFCVNKSFYLGVRLCLSHAYSFLSNAFCNAIHVFAVLIEACSRLVANMIFKDARPANTDPKYFASTLNVAAASLNDSSRGAITSSLMSSPG